MKLESLINENLGYNGRMIGYSKTKYRESHPKSICYFNGCIFDEKLKQVWWGDIDVTLDMGKLVKIAKIYKKPFYVTPEHPFRTDFNKVTKKLLDEDTTVIKFNDKSGKLTKKQVIEYMRTEIRMFKWDFKSKEYGEKAKLLHNHYKRILELIQKMECKK